MSDLIEVLQERNHKKKKKLKNKIREEKQTIQKSINVNYIMIKNYSLKCRNMNGPFNFIRSIIHASERIS